MTRLFRWLLGSALLSGFGAVALPAGAAVPSTAEMSARYAKADTVSDPILSSLVLNETIAPHWLGTGGEFWYRHARKDGGEYRWVKSDGTVAPAFDHGRLAAAIAKVTSSQISPWSLTATAISETTVTLTAGKTVLNCSLVTYACDSAQISVVNPRLSRSPDGAQALFTRADNVWIRDVKSGQETPLTQDGQPYYAWGKLPDGVLLTLVNERSPLPVPPWGFSWSPDSRFVIGGRLDERDLKPYPFLESVPTDGSFRPRVRTIRTALLGEPGPTSESVVFDTKSGKRTTIALPKDEISAFTDIYGWSVDGTRFYTSSMNAQTRALSLIEVSALTGAVRTLVTEHPQGFISQNALLYSAPNVRVISQGAQILWYSQRSGWGQLYRYDLETGKLLNVVTQGDWLVRDILAVDEFHERIIFTASGREPSADPYRRRVYRVDFDGSHLTLLTPEDADHSLDGQPIPLILLFFGQPPTPDYVSPDGSTLIDTYSTVTTAPVSVLRRVSDGKVIAKLEEADLSSLTARGWRMPEPFTAKAADGNTDLYGALYWPDAAAGNKVPLVDALYGGPQVSVGPHNFHQTHASYGAFALSQLGFATVVFDGRATPGRSQAFQDVGFENFGDVATDDHAAVIKQLLARYPRLDAEHVGVTGHSFGGYVSTRAMLRHPEVYKVGVSSAGPHIYEASYPMGGFMALADYGHGQTLRPTPNAVALNYHELDNAPLAANLRGHLLLGMGDMDENAYPAITLQFIAALTKANRRYDLVYLPNTTHRYNSYFDHRRWDYFTEHLLNVEPPLPPYVAPH